MDQSAMFQLSYGVYLASVTYDGKDNGCIVNSFAQVTNEPIQVSLTLNKKNLTEAMIEQAKQFHVTTLSKQVDMELIRSFGFRSGNDVDKFAQVNHVKRDTLGNAYIEDGGCASYTCKVVQTMDLGTHVMFIAEVIDAEVINKEEPMTYAYYHQVKNGTTPPNATTYQKEVKQTGWRCTICGYIYEGETLPEDYVCPICNAPASVFEKIG